MASPRLSIASPPPPAPGAQTGVSWFDYSKTASLPEDFLVLLNDPNKRRVFETFVNKSPNKHALEFLKALPHYKARCRELSKSEMEARDDELRKEAEALFSKFFTPTHGSEILGLDVNIKKQLEEKLFNRQMSESPVDPSPLHQASQGRPSEYWEGLYDTAQDQVWLLFLEEVFPLFLKSDDFQQILAKTGAGRKGTVGTGPAPLKPKKESAAGSHGGPQVAGSAGGKQAGSHQAGPAAEAKRGDVLERRHAVRSNWLDDREVVRLRDEMKQEAAELLHDLRVSVMMKGTFFEKGAGQAVDMKKRSFLFLQLSPDGSSLVFGTIGELGLTGPGPQANTAAPRKLEHTVSFREKSHSNAPVPSIVPLRDVLEVAEGVQDQAGVSSGASGGLANSGPGTPSPLTGSGSPGGRTGSIGGAVGGSDSPKVVRTAVKKGSDADLGPVPRTHKFVFSIVMKDQSVVLTAASKDEYLTWVDGLRGLMADPATRYTSARWTAQTFKDIEMLAEVLALDLLYLPPAVPELPDNYNFGDP